MKINSAVQSAVIAVLKGIQSYTNKIYSHILIAMSPATFFGGSPVLSGINTANVNNASGCDLSGNTRQ